MTAIYTALEEKLELVRSELNAEIDRLSNALADLSGKMETEIKARQEAEYFARRATSDAYNAIRAMHEARGERDEAKRHLRQLLHALDSERGPGNAPPSHSISVKLAMVETRRYLQAPAGRDEE